MIKHSRRKTFAVCQQYSLCWGNFCGLYKSGLSLWPILVFWLRSRNISVAKHSQLAKICRNCKSFPSQMIYRTYHMVYTTCILFLAMVYLTSIFALLLCYCQGSIMWSFHTKTLWVLLSYLNSYKLMHFNCIMHYGSYRNI